MSDEFGEVSGIIDLVINFLAGGTLFLNSYDTLSYSPLIAYRALLLVVVKVRFCHRWKTNILSHVESQIMSSLISKQLIKRSHVICHGYLSCNIYSHHSWLCHEAILLLDTLNMYPTPQNPSCFVISRAVA